METSYPANDGDVARITSPTVDGNIEQCMEFWYHMYGEDVDQLAVYYYVQTASGAMKLSAPVWRKVGNHGDHWLLGQVNYEGGNATVKNFIFEGTVGYSFQGDIALGKNKIFDFYKSFF